MRQLTYVEAGQVAWQDAPDPEARGPAGRDRPPARGRALRPRSDHGRLRHLPGAVRRRARDGRRDRRRRRRRARPPRRRARPRPVPGLVRQLRGVPRRALRRLSHLPREGRRGVRLRRGRRRPRRRGRRPARGPARRPPADRRAPEGSAPRRSARCRTTSPTATARSHRSSPRSPAPRSSSSAARPRRSASTRSRPRIACGAGRVRYADSDADRCAAATALGADVTQLDGPWPRRLDRAPIVVENTADVDGLACALRSTDDYGTCTSVAIHFAPTTPMPLLELYTKGITYHLSRADSRRFLPEVIDARRERRARPARRADDDRPVGPGRRGVARARDEARARAGVGRATDGERPGPTSRSARA